MKRNNSGAFSIMSALAMMLSVLFLYSCNETKKLTPVVTTKNLRAPAYPLVTIDPYTSAWSTTDQLFDGPVRHWTGKRHGLIGAIRVDGKVYRFLGKEELPRKAIVPMANEGAWDCVYTNVKQLSDGKSQDSMHRNGRPGRALLVLMACPIWQLRG